MYTALVVCGRDEGWVVHRRGEGDEWCVRGVWYVGGVRVMSGVWCVGGWGWQVTEEAGYSWTLQIKNDFSYLNRLALSTFTEVAPSFQIKIQGWGQSLKSFLPCSIQDKLVMTSVVLISKGQPCPTFPVQLIGCSLPMYLFIRGANLFSLRTQAWN